MAELEPLPRMCARCGASLEGMRSHAVYCSRSCKNKESNRRRRDDGRSAARDRERYRRNPEPRRELAKKYHRKNPGRAQESKRRRKARFRSAECHLVTLDDWDKLVRRFDHCCAYCGVQDTDLQREHVVPLSRGGSHSIGNIVPACSACNYSKGPKLLSEWRYAVPGVSP